MKKALFILVAIVAMGGLANAQQHCKQSGCSVGYYDPDGFYVFGTCQDHNAVDCEHDVYNCGSVGNVCPSYYSCNNSLCVLDCSNRPDAPSCGGQAQAMPPLALKLKRQYQRLG